jgi:hypothetical protein
VANSHRGTPDFWSSDVLFLRPVLFIALSLLNDDSM